MINIIKISHLKIFIIYKDDVFHIKYRIYPATNLLYYDRKRKQVSLKLDKYA